MKLLIYCFLLLPATIFAQSQQQLDSMEKTLLKKSGTERIRTLNDLAFYYSRKNTDKSLKFGNEAMRLARKQPDKALLASTLNDLSTPYITIGDYEKSIALNNEALQIRTQLKDSSGMLSSFAKLGLSYQDRGDYEKAIGYYKDALYLSRKLRLEQQQAQLLNNLGNILEFAGHLREAYDTQKDALVLARKLQATDAVITILGNLGNTATKLKLYKESKKYFDEVIPMIENSGEKEYLATVYQSVGVLERAQRHHEKGLEFYLKALEIYQEINSRPGIAVLSSNIGLTYLSKKDAGNAEKYFRLSLENARFTKSAKQLKNAYEGLSKVEKLKGNTADALKYLELSSAYKDSAQLEQGNSAMSEMYIKYRTEKKDRELAEIRLKNAKQAEAVANTNLKLEKERENRILYISVGLFLLLVVAFVTRNLYIKRKAALEEVKLTRKNEQLRRERELNEQKLEISRELHDNIGSQITYMISSMDNLTYTIPEEEQLNSRLRSISEFGRDTMQELRSTIWAMNHVDGTSDTFIEKLGELRSKIPVELEIRNELSAPHSLKALEMLNLFRIAQESIQNAIKYSGCSKITIRIGENERGSTFLEIADDGKGFDRQKASEGNGLRNMKHRCETIGGSFSMQSGSGGTEISCDIRHLTKQEMSFRP